MSRYLLFELAVDIFISKSLGVKAAWHKVNLVFDEMVYVYKCVSTFY